MNKKKRRRKLVSDEVIVKGPEGPKLTISIFQMYHLSENVLHQARQWRSSMWRKGRG